MSENPTVPQPQSVPMPPEPEPQSVDLNPEEVDLNGETLYDGDVEDTASDEDGEPEQPQHEVYDEDGDGVPDFDAEEADENEDQA